MPGNRNIFREVGYRYTINVQREILSYLSHSNFTFCFICLWFRHLFIYNYSVLCLVLYKNNQNMKILNIFSWITLKKKLGKCCSVDWFIFNNVWFITLPIIKLLRLEMLVLKMKNVKWKKINDLNVLLIYFCIRIQYADPSIKVEIKCFHLDYVIVYFEIEIMNVGCICKRNVT